MFFIQRVILRNVSNQMAKAVADNYQELTKAYSWGYLQFDGLVALESERPAAG